MLGARGRLWVRRDRHPLGESGGGRWDVYDRELRYLGEVDAPASAGLRAARGDTVWAIVRGEYDEAWLVAYEVAP